MFDLYIAEALTLFMVHSLAVVSPGPDFALTMKQSIVHGKRAGLMTALGVALGICVHISYSILGVGLIIAQSEQLFFIAQCIGTAYLTYVGLNLLLAKKQSSPMEQMESVDQPFRHRGFLFSGFLCNVLNPKATLFFIAIFSSVVQAQTPLSIQYIYGVFIFISTLAWFSFVAYFFSNRNIREKFLKRQHIFERTMGVAILSFAAKLALSVP